MLLSFITPTPYIKDYQSQGDFILALSHLIDREKENEYEKAIKETNLPIILDNGLFENHYPEGIDSLLSKAIKIGATHFFAPDHLYDSKATQRSLENTIYIRKKLGLEDKINIAAVVQADNREDYLNQYKDFCNNPDVDLIGLSILAIPRSYTKQVVTKKNPYQHDDQEIIPTRIELLKDLPTLDIEHTNCHMLGLGDSYEDVKFAADNCPFVISNDTSSAFWNGIQGKAIKKDLRVEGGKTKVKVDFDFDNATPEQLALAQLNINEVKSQIN